MPKKLERKLKRQVAKKNWSKERKNAYVYGALRKTGWKPSHQKRKKSDLSSHTDPVAKKAINRIRS